jgi:hypothetical protein
MKNGTAQRQESTMTDRRKVSVASPVSPGFLGAVELAAHDVLGERRDARNTFTCSSRTRSASTS